MNIDTLRARLRKLRNMRKFCRDNDLSERTAWRVMAPQSNPTTATAAAFAAALTRRKPPKDDL